MGRDPFDEFFTGDEPNPELTAAVERLIHAQLDLLAAGPLDKQAEPPEQANSTAAMATVAAALHAVQLVAKQATDEDAGMFLAWHTASLIAEAAIARWCDAVGISRDDAIAELHVHFAADEDQP